MKVCSLVLCSGPTADCSGGGGARKVDEQNGAREDRIISDRRRGWKYALSGGLSILPSHLSPGLLGGVTCFSFFLRFIFLVSDPAPEPAHTTR